MNTQNHTDRRGGERNLLHRGEPMTVWAWLGLAIVVAVFYGMAVSSSLPPEVSEVATVNPSGALGPEEIVLLCRNAGGKVAVTAAIHFGEKKISETVLVDNGSIHCTGHGFVDSRDILAMGVNEMLRFLPVKEELDSGVAEAASYSTE